jgi:hypothetical protein
VLGEAPSLTGTLRSKQKVAPKASLQMQGNYEGASRILCEWLQRVFGSVLVHSVKNTEKYSFAAVAGGEGSSRDCGTDAAVHFDKKSCWITLVAVADGTVL